MDIKANDRRDVELKAVDQLERFLLNPVKKRRSGRRSPSSYVVVISKSEADVGFVLRVHCHHC